MKSENQICTIEQAERLKALGIIQCIAIYRQCYVNDPSGTDTKSYLLSEDEWWLTDHAFTQSVDRFSVSELGVMLPANNLQVQKSVSEKEWNVLLCDFERFPTEAQGRAALLIYLLEKNIITAEDVNQRLKEAE